MMNVFRKQGEQIIEGTLLPAIIHNGFYFLTNIAIYKDGLIDAWGLMDFDEFQNKLDSGWITLEVPDGGVLYMPDWGEIEVSSFKNNRSKEDFIKHVKYLIDWLNGRTDIFSVCMELFRTYLIEPSMDNFNALKKAYIDLPGNAKAVFEPVDYKDPLVGLIERNEKFSAEQRKYMLLDYFDEENIEIKDYQ